MSVPRSFLEQERASRRARPSTRTLTQVVLLFFRFLSPCLIAALALGSLAARVWVGGWQSWEAVILVGVALYWPFQEWAAHRWVLHLKPFRVLGLKIDPYFARRHRRHHNNPAHFPDVFLPPGVVLSSYVVFCALGWLTLGSAGPLLTLMASVSFAALLYEWTHYIAHTDYKPRSAYWRRVIRSHRAHHYRSEHHWYGFTVPHIDDWFGTGGDTRHVDASETVRTLGCEPEAPAVDP